MTGEHGMFSSHLRLEKQQRRRLKLEQPAPSPQHNELASASSSHRKGGQLQEAWFKTQLHVVHQLSATLRPSGRKAWHSTRERMSMQPLQPWKRGNKCLELLQGDNRQDGLKTLNPPKAPQLRPVEHFLGSLKQAVYAGSWEASNIELKKRDHLEVKDIDVGLLRNSVRGPWPRSDMLSTMAFWLSCK